MGVVGSSTARRRLGGEDALEKGWSRLLLDEDRGCDMVRTTSLLIMV